MKTAGRKTKATNVVASRAHGTEGQNNPAPSGGLDGKKNSGQGRSVFSLTSFMELIGTWEVLRFHSRLEKSSDEVEDVKDDRPIDPHPNDRPFGLASNSLGEVRHVASLRYAYRERRPPH